MHVYMQKNDLGVDKGHLWLSQHSGVIGQLILLIYL